MKVGFVPLDDRPCTKEFAGAVARIAGEELVTPPASLLGHFLTPGSPEGIISWLNETGPQLDALVASIDMLAYGGLIASRAPEPGYAVARERVSALASIKDTEPHLRILAFNVLMRSSITCFDAASARHWEMVHRLNILEDKASLGLCSKEELAERDRLLADVPAEVLSGYRQARARNHAINLFSLDLVGAGVIDFLSFCQEDAHVFGPHRAEQLALRERVRALSLSERVKIYAGTDEAGMLLVARAINEFRGLVPRFGFLYTPPGAERNVAVFEDRPVEDNIRLQVSVTRGEVVSPRGPAPGPDCLCLVNCPPNSSPEDGCQSEAPSDSSSRAAPSRSSAFEHFRSAVEAGVPSGVLDIARPNGADPAFMVELARHVDIARLTAYSAWNTAGNSTGTVIAVLSAANAALKCGTLRPLQAGRADVGDCENVVSDGAQDVDKGIRPLRETPGGISSEALPDPDYRTPVGPLASLCRFLFERFVDDWLYQSIVRAEVNSWFASASGVNLYQLGLPEPYGKVNAMVRERLVALARDLYARLFSGRPVPLLPSPAKSARAGELVGAVVWPSTDRLGLEVRLPWERTFEVEVRASW